jgi:hypothetical protein
VKENEEWLLIFACQGFACPFIKKLEVVGVVEKNGGLEREEE